MLNEQYLAENSLIPLVACLGLVGAGVLTAYTTFWSLPPKVVAGSAAASGIAVINCVGQLGGIVSPIAVLADSDGQEYKLGQTNEVAKRLRESLLAIQERGAPDPFGWTREVV